MAIEGEESDYYVYTMELLKTVDRGGLFYVNESTFLFFCAVELATQAFLPNHLHSSSESSTKGLQDQIIADEDVQFYWSMVSVDLQDELSSELLQHIIDVWVKMRGFVLTSAWMEARGGSRGGLRVLKHLPKVNYLLLLLRYYQLSNSIIQQLCLLMKLKS